MARVWSLIALRSTSAGPFPTNGTSFGVGWHEFTLSATCLYRIGKLPDDIIATLYFHKLLRPIKPPNVELTRRGEQHTPSNQSS